MEAQLFAIYDLASQSYTAPFAAPNNAVAQRIFTNERRNPNSDIYKHPTDFELCRIGTFDYTTGNLIPHAPTRIARAAEITTE